LMLESAAGAGAMRVRVADWVPPFKEAVMVAASLEETLETDAANCALPWPARIVTAAGTLTFALPSERETEVFAGAASASDTVQVAVPEEVKLVGEQERELKTEAAGATRFSCALRFTPL